MIIKKLLQQKDKCPYCNSIWVWWDFINRTKGQKPLNWCLNCEMEWESNLVPSNTLSIKEIDKYKKTLLGRLFK